jgi:hypothetical protein
MEFFLKSPRQNSMKILQRHTGWSGGVKSTMGVRNFGLQRSQLRKRGTIGLNQSATYIHPFHTVTPVFILFAPFELSSLKKVLLGRIKILLDMVSIHGILLSSCSLCNKHLTTDWRGWIITYTNWYDVTFKSCICSYNLPEYLLLFYSYKQNAISNVMWKGWWLHKIISEAWAQCQVHAYKIWC